MEELRLRYQPEVARLSEYLGRDMLARWGYDSRGDRLAPRRRGA